MKRTIALVALLVLVLGACVDVTEVTSTTGIAGSTSTTPGLSTSTTDVAKTDTGWAIADPEGIHHSDGKEIWSTDPVFAWYTLVRDQSGGFVFVDAAGLWWIPAGELEARRVSSLTGDLVEIAFGDQGPVAVLGICDPRFIRLDNGAEDGPVVNRKVETSCDPSTATIWQAANGLSASIIGPETDLNAEGQVEEVVEPAVLRVSRGLDPLMEVVVGGVNEPYARIHDFDGQRIIISRGPFEPALPEETFFVVDLRTGTVLSTFRAAATTVAFLGPDASWQGEPIMPDLRATSRADIVTAIEEQYVP